MTSTLFTNGTVWMGPAQLDETALYLVDGRVAAIGAEARARARASADTTVMDLAGGFLMPAFGEGHAHPVFGGLEDCGPQIRACTSVAEIVDEVRRYADDNPELDWILGASYDGSFAPGGLFEARWLDEAVSDRPVVLRAWDYHTVWCNSRALELAGINADTPEPELGEIPRRSDGTPIGVLREWGAVDLINAVSPGFTLDQRVDALRRATAHFASLGVTWVQDAWVEPNDIDVYIRAAETGALSTRINLALLADPRQMPGSFSDLLDARERVARLGHPLLTANSVKFFVDGVVENETGALLEPYCSGMHDHGMLLWQPEQLADAVARVDAAGFQPHLHAIGDAAVRQALDAIEHAERVNPPSDRRPVIAHVQLANADDLARFVKLGVIAVMQPYWAQLDDLMTVLTVPRLGPERTNRQYRMRTLADSGATLAFGSDWPCSSAAPLDGLGIAISRTTPEGEPAGGWTPAERLDPETALAAYSSGVARQAFADQTDAPWGVIELGASADLVWLAADPRTTNAAELPSLTVQATYLSGTITYRASAPVLTAV